MAFSKSRLGRGFLLSLGLSALVASSGWALGNEPDDIIGTVTSVFRSVKVLPKGRGGPSKQVAVSKGYKVRLADVIFTGP